MAEGPSSYLCDKWLQATFKNSSFVVAQAYLQLHTAAPGVAGTTSVVVGASGADRKAVTMGTPAPVTGVITIANSAQVQWLALTNANDATHYSLWDALTVGNFLGSGIINANAYGAGDSLTFAIGAITIALNYAYP
jgi:hypothetical protein